MEHYNTVVTWLPKDTKSLLDVGAGYGILAVLLRQYTKLERLDAIDIFPANRDRCRLLYDAFFVGDMIEVLSKMPSRSYDVVVCLGTIEHIAQPLHAVLLQEMERVAAKRVIFLSTTRFMQNNPDDPWVAENPHQQHVSEITPKTARQHGYRVRGEGRFLNWGAGVGLFKRWFVRGFPYYNAYKDVGGGKEVN